MGLDAADLPELAQLFAPMATAAVFGPALPPGAPPPDGLQGDVDKTRAWLAALDDASAGMLLAKFAFVPRVAAALARLQSPPAPASIDGPWPWLLRVQPAVNRHQFWQHLKELLAPENKRILIIKGGRQVGKTFTGEYILPELRNRTRSRAVPIRAVHQAVDGAGSVENVVSSVFAKLDLSLAGMPTLEVQRSNDVAARKEWWVKETARWFVEKLHADSSRQVWLAFDGHVNNGPGGYLSEFFTEVVVQVGRRIWDPNGCRLFLIDHPEGLSGVADIVTLREEIKLPTEADVTVFLEGMLGAGDNTNQKAAAIWAKVTQAAEIDRMPILTQELQSVRQP